MGILESMLRFVGLSTERRTRPGAPGHRTTDEDGDGDLRVELPWPIRAERPGDLGSLGALGLPPGRIVRPDEDETADPVLWLADSVADHRATWAALAARFPQTGLWPVLVQGLGEDLERPWYGGELDGPQGPVPDVAEVLQERWSEAVEVLEEYDEDELDDDQRRVRDAGPVLALAPAQPVGATVQLELGAGTSGLALVPVGRPADVPSAIGWWGTANVDLDGSDVAAVLRSWEDRFGATLVAMGFDTIHLEVAAPPSSSNDVATLILEHYAFCPDNIDQGVGSLPAYAPVVRAHHWTFWWD
ncbi:protein of unknown function [Raineyella antarctica]|uniref:DUF4253 domain-containing protein n=1 Tax=Raineyella antarctica TaxID=1577474 RepID=A0A1G6H4E8_9ACTN|nr:DUF4253 domain-containing protein [Raineyella antarctica]SDB88785.1 protein of unknown function [Raineyella antarctica]